MKAQFTYRRPKYTHPVKGRTDVGLSGEGDYYACETTLGWSPPSGYGTGATPEEARRNAAASLHRKLTEVS